MSKTYLHTLHTKYIYSKIMVREQLLKVYYFSLEDTSLYLTHKHLLDNISKIPPIKKRLSDSVPTEQSQ